MIIEVRTRASIRDIPTDKPYAVISICDSDQALAEVPGGEMCQGVLRLAFDDIDRPSPGRVPFDFDHAEDILEFWHGLPDLHVLFVHCNAGQCRSPAVAAALTKIAGGDDEPWFQRYRPNRHVYRTLLQCG